MFEKSKKMFHKIRRSDNLVCRNIVAGKDWIWGMKRRSILRHNERSVSRASQNENALSLSTGLDLLGHIRLRTLLEGPMPKIKIPKDIRFIKIDIGLSFAAPNSALWLERLPDRIVFGFEPNPENVEELLSGENRKRGSEYHYLGLEHINKRFFLFNAAIDIDEPCLKTFYMTMGDPGTSSLHRPELFKIKRVIRVPTIRLADFLDLIPWDRFDFIEHVKIDAQGNDLRILRSAGSYLTDRIVFVSAECSTKNQYVHSHTEAELDDFMKKNGFEFIPGMRYAENKTYVNCRFKNMSKNLDNSTEGF